ncbi:MAG TPA: hypothetical protein VGB46_04280 [Flavisolibacter sp.]|jgi:hypothetical protein
MEYKQQPTNDATQELCSQIADETGVEVENVRKVLETLNADKNINEAAKLLGSSPRLKDAFIGFRISESTVVK